MSVFNRTRTEMAFAPKGYLPGPTTAKRYGIADRSLYRWEKDPNLDFPKPLVINKRRFFALDELEAWELSLASNCRKAACP